MIGEKERRGESKGVCENTERSRERARARTPQAGSQALPVSSGCLASDRAPGGPPR